MKELTQRLSGREGSNMFVMMHSPWFEFSIDQAMQELSLRKQVTPTQLSLQQWLVMYKKLTKNG